MIRRLLLVLIFACGANAATIDITQYIAELQRLDMLLASNDLATARSEAQRIMAFDIASAQGTFHADESLLRQIADPHVPVTQSRARLNVAITELRRMTGIEGTAADRKLLEEVTQSQEVEELKEGGEITTTIPAEIPMAERILNSLSDMIQWVVKWLGKILRWLLDLLPGRSGSMGGPLAGIRWAVWVVVGAIVLVVVALALLVIRRSKRATASAAQSSEPIGSQRDEDPLSRGASEWERYAMQLGDEGRYREAIRAWFHAVLVTCYAQSILHFRKGRTNWEYIASLSPSHTWRPELIALTRRFEQEWYGSDTSNEEAMRECSTRAQRILDALHRMRGAAA